MRAEPNTKVGIANLPFDQIANDNINSSNYQWLEMTLKYVQGALLTIDSTAI